MTYLEAVNNVLRRLRQDEVQTVNATDYSSLVGDFVNDALAVVESSWKWTDRSGFRTIATTGNPNITVTNIGDNAKITSVFFGSTTDPKDATEVQYRNYEWINSQDTSVEGNPNYWSYASSDSILRLYPTPPSGSYVFLYTDEDILSPLTNDFDSILVPHLPVIHLALAFAARERGETGGTTTQEYFNVADRYLQDAIAVDASRRPEKTLWYY